MIVIEKQIVDLLQADAGLTALSAEVYRGHVPKSCTWATPVVRVVQGPGTPDYYLEGEAGKADADLQIDVWGTNATNTDATADRVRAVLSTHKDATFRYVKLTAVQALSEPPSNGSDGWSSRVILTFQARFWTA